MGRRLRPQGHGLTHHVMARGNNRRDIFDDDLDRRSFLDLLDETRRKRGWRIHAWCLMTNHVHLLLSTQDSDLSPGLRDTLGRYARRYNHFHERTGHLFGQRFRSVLVTSDEQFLTVVRYINRNPVRAGLTDDPGLYPWSGYALRRRPRPPVALDERTTLEMLHPIAATAERRLDELVHAEQSPSRTGPGRPTIAMLIQAMGATRGARAAAALGHPRREIAAALGLSRSGLHRRLANVP